jgi:hypothetical protein
MNNKNKLVNVVKFKTLSFCQFLYVITRRKSLKTCVVSTNFKNGIFLIYK